MSERYLKRIGSAMIWALAALTAAQGKAQDAGAQDAEKVEWERASKLYDANDRLDALPLFEDLVKINSQSAVYAERLASCLAAKERLTQDPAEHESLRQRGLAEAKRAQSLGDTSNYLMLLLDILAKPAQPPPPNATVSPAQPFVDEGDASFAKGDLDAALNDYIEGTKRDPKFYLAPLFAGDMEFRKKDADAAGKWFEQAIAVDPNVETAYRYWGDALDAAGRSEEARAKFVEAIVAEPYSRKSWMGLTQWAGKHKVTLAAPKIDLPSGPTVDADGKIQITLDPAQALSKDPNAPAWFAYTASRALWRGDKFKQTFPQEKEYRHSLAEELSSLQSTIAVAKEQKIPAKKLDLRLKTLMELNDAGMLEAWILISHADKGIAADYAAYRDAHRPQLRSYLERFVIHDDKLGVGNL